MPFERIEYPFLEFLIVFLNVPHSCHIVQFQAVIHFYTQRIEGIDYLFGIYDNGTVCIGEPGQEVIFQLGIKIQLYALRINQNQLKVCLLYTSDAADDLLCLDLGGRPIIKKKNTH